MPRWKLQLPIEIGGHLGDGIQPAGTVDLDGPCTNLRVAPRSVTQQLCIGDPLSTLCIGECSDGVDDYEEYCVYDGGRDGAGRRCIVACWSKDYETHSAGTADLVVSCANRRVVPTVVLDQPVHRRLCEGWSNNCDQAEMSALRLSVSKSRRQAGAPLRLVKALQHAAPSVTQQTVYAADSEYEDWTEAHWPAKAKNYAPQFIAAVLMLLERAPRVQPQAISRNARRRSLGANRVH